MFERTTSSADMDPDLMKLLIEELASEPGGDVRRNGDQEDSSGTTAHGETVVGAPIPLVSREPAGDGAAGESDGGPDDAPLPLEPARAEPAAAEPVAPAPPPAAVAPTVQRWQLRIVQPGGQECVMPLEDKPIVVGRERECSIVLKCDRVSRRHAEIRLSDAGPRIDDLGSRNGILVNGTKVPAAFLKPRDVVHVGSVAIHVEPSG